MNIDNVIILGAGASFDAGIPLLDGFVEKIRYFAWKGESKNGTLSEEDRIIFQRAIEIMNELDSYHGRAAFDDRNLEDLLSILAFNIIGGERYGNQKLEQMIEAIARTIELTCEVKHDGNLTSIQHSGVGYYRSFWKKIIKEYNKNGQIPTIITLNYDLVFERSLLQTLITDEFIENKFDGVIIRYHYSDLSFSFKLEETTFEKLTFGEYKKVGGYIVEKCEESDLGKPLTIEYLKLHGSVNFPKTMNSKKQLTPSFISTVDKPFIVPPISNKSLSNKSEDMWRIALDRIQKCKNLYIVGYSLPKTDIYFQFFLKTALGPNKDFNKIFVYNPALFSDNGKTDIEKRYEECFPEQLRKYIEFHPDCNPNVKPGSFENFVQNLSSDTFFY
jgi:hypothetical protein